MVTHEVLSMIPEKRPCEGCSAERGPSVYKCLQVINKLGQVPIGVPSGKLSGIGLPRRLKGATYSMHIYTFFCRSEKRQSDGREYKYKARFSLQTGFFN